MPLASPKLCQPKISPGTFLVVQQLGLGASTAGCTGSISGPRTKILHAVTKKKKSSDTTTCTLVGKIVPSRGPLIRVVLGRKFLKPFLWQHLSPSVILSSSWLEYSMTLRLSEFKKGWLVFSHHLSVSEYQQWRWLLGKVPVNCCWRSRVSQQRYWPQWTRSQTQ